MFVYWEATNDRAFTLVELLGEVWDDVLLVRLSTTREYFLFLYYVSNSMFGVCYRQRAWSIPGYDSRHCEIDSSFINEDSTTRYLYKCISSLISFSINSVNLRLFAFWQCTVTTICWQRRMWNTLMHWTRNWRNWFDASIWRNTSSLGISTRTTRSVCFGWIEMNIHRLLDNENDSIDLFHSPFCLYSIQTDLSSWIHCCFSIYTVQVSYVAIEHCHDSGLPWLLLCEYELNR